MIRVNKNLHTTVRQNVHTVKESELYEMLTWLISKYASQDNNNPSLPYDHNFIHSLYLVTIKITCAVVVSNSFFFYFICSEFCHTLK